MSRIRRIPAPFALALVSITSSAWAAGPGFMIEIADTGAYRISHEQLAELSPDLGEIDSRLLHLSMAGQPRHLHVHDGGDGRFGPGDHISFFGERLFGQQGWFNTYAVHNVYTLAVGDEPATLTVPEPLATTTDAHLRRQLHLEEENLQIRLNNRLVQPGDEPDLWQWAKLTQIDAEPFQVPFTLPGLAANGEVRVRLNFRGLSEVRPLMWGQPKPTHDHEVEISLNGAVLQRVQFEGRHEHEVEIDLPVRSLQASDNRLELRVPRRMLPSQRDPVVDVVMFNYVHLDYPITGELDSTPLPIQVEQPGTAWLQSPAGAGMLMYGRNGARMEGQRDHDGRWRFEHLGIDEYQPVADHAYSEPVRIRTSSSAHWREVEHGYDYLLISHGSLAEAARPLAEHHRRNDLRVAEIDVEHLYDEFNHGVTHPRAIRNFIAHAHEHWPEPRPRFVLLVGDASFDIRSDRIEDTRYAKWANLQSEAQREGDFATIRGGVYEEEAKIGSQRNLIPTWQYPSEEGHSAADNYFVALGEGWLPNLAIGRFPVAEPQEVTDIVEKTIRYATNMDFGDWRRRMLFTTDTAQHFQNSSTQMAQSLEPDGFVSSLVFADREASDNEPQINALNDALNEGQLLVHFIGHGGRYIWRTGPPDPRRNHDLFTLDHVAQLNNGDRLPMVLSMTCYSAPFDHPNADSIGERFLREPDKGAIAVFAASWRNSPEPIFSQTAVDELMTPGATIGEALMRAKHVLTRPHQRTLVETYNLLGDPAVVLQRPSLPLTLQAHGEADHSSLELSAGEQPVNGRAVLEWLDENGTVLARSERELRGRRARFQTPEPAAQAHQVSAHLIDYRTRSDGFATLSLTDAAPSPDAQP